MVRGFKKGGGATPKGLKDLLKQAQSIQANVSSAKALIESQTFSGQSGGGAVKVVLSGRFRLERLEIAEELLRPEEKEMLEELVLAAINSVVDEIHEKVEAEMERASAGLPLPGVG